MEQIFEQQLQSKRNELRALHETFGGEFSDGGNGLHVLLNMDATVSEIRITIAYVLSPQIGIYFKAGFGEDTDPQVYKQSAIYRMRFPTAGMAYAAAIQAAKKANNPLI